MTDQEKILLLKQALEPFLHFRSFILAGAELGYVDAPTPTTMVSSIMCGGGSDYIFWSTLEDAYEAYRRV